MCGVGSFQLANRPTLYHALLYIQDNRSPQDLQPDSVQAGWPTPFFTGVKADLWLRLAYRIKGLESYKTSCMGCASWLYQTGSGLLKTENNHLHGEEHQGTLSIYGCNSNLEMIKADTRHHSDDRLCPLSKFLVKAATEFEEISSKFLFSELVELIIKQESTFTVNKIKAISSSRLHLNGHWKRERGEKKKS